MEDMMMMSRRRRRRRRSWRFQFCAQKDFTCHEAQASMRKKGLGEGQELHGKQKSVLL
jgi:hypothetical protein